MGVRFEVGNAVATRHGSYSRDFNLSSEPRVIELAELIRETQPVSHPCDEGAIWRLALVYRRIELSAVALDRADEVAAEEGSEWQARLRDDHDRWIGRAGRIEAELGRTPTSRAKLGLRLALGHRAMSIVELHREAALETLQDAVPPEGA